MWPAFRAYCSLRNNIGNTEGTISETGPIFQVNVLFPQFAAYTNLDILYICTVSMLYVLPTTKIKRKRTCQVILSFSSCVVITKHIGNNNLMKV